MRVASLVMRCLDQVLERDVAVNETFGFVQRCAMQSAGHVTDYVIDEGTAWMIGGVRTERLLELAKDAGYLKPIRRGRTRSWLLVDDADFLHMRTRAEIDWERQRKTDNANPALIIPVRRRDGDACRYCGTIVNWVARKGKLAATYDHRDPGKTATVGTLVVSCGACNAGRRDDPEADRRYPLRPEPPHPFYSAASADLLAKHGFTVTATDNLRPGSQPDNATRPGTQPDNAPSDPATSGTTRTPAARLATVAPTTTPQPAHHGPRAGPGSADPADRLPAESGYAGSGRDGSGSSRVRNPAGTRASPAAVRRRSSRGKPPTGGNR